MEPDAPYPVVRDFQVVVDCREPARLADFWAQALGYTSDPPPGDHADWMGYQVAMGFPDSDRVEFAAISDPRGHGRLCFMAVPEPKASKNRLHLDVQASERGDGIDERIRRVDALVARLCALGGTAVRTGRERGQYYVTMLDVEGNEFCVH